MSATSILKARSQIKNLKKGDMEELGETSFKYANN